MVSILISSSILLWIVLLANLMLTVALIRRFNQLSLQMADLSGASEGLAPGTLAPHFEAETLAGETVTLTDYARQAVSFIFFSPHCEPCLEKLAELKTLAPRAKAAGLEMVLVDTESNRREAETFVQENDVTLPVLLAPFGSNPFAQDYKAMGTPFFCQINQDSEVEASGGFGPEWEQIMQGLVQSDLNDPIANTLYLSGKIGL